MDRNLALEAVRVTEAAALASARLMGRGEVAPTDRAAAEANSQVAQTLFKKAIAGDTTAAIFWLKCRAGWRERGTAEPGPALAPPFVVSAKEVA